MRYPPSWFKGGVYDVKVNTGVVMPAGCSVLNVLGQRLDSSYNNWGPPLSYLSLVTHGYTITRPGGIAARNLDADARVWHNGTHAIRSRSTTRSRSRTASTATCPARRFMAGIRVPFKA